MSSVFPISQHTKNEGRIMLSSDLSKRKKVISVHPEHPSSKLQTVCTQIFLTVIYKRGDFPFLLAIILKNKGLAIILKNKGLKFPSSK